MDSAHQLNESNIQVKYNENHSKGSGDMEQTRNSRVNPMILNCGLESAKVLLIVSLRLTFR